jgi:hypothetical protein
MIECVIIPVLEYYVIGNGESYTDYIAFLIDYDGKIQYGGWWR